MQLSYVEVGEDNSKHLAAISQLLAPDVYNCAV